MGLEAGNARGSPLSEAGSRGREIPRQCHLNTRPVAAPGYIIELYLFPCPYISNGPVNQWFNETAG